MTSFTMTGRWSLAVLCLQLATAREATCNSSGAVSLLQAGFKTTKAATLAWQCPYALRVVMDQAYSLESASFPNNYIRHSGFKGKIDPEESLTGELNQQDASFVARMGLGAGECSVSFESVNFPEYFLRHSYFWMRLDSNDNSDLFKEDASFFPRPGLHN
mmetsp:Transcript_22827/g.52227  ORF Transcript_22827/g.52227 Transcript_22827/m.52227 type:complete len:160 (-) Transcript_22827:244-723(-)